MFTTVHTKPNRVAINISVGHIDGTKKKMVIQPQDALIDQFGTILFFKIVYPDGDIQGYKLLPYKTTPDKVGTWIFDFIAGFGLSRIGSQLVTGKGLAANLGRHIAFSNPGGGLIRSFLSDRYADSHMGYHNILTDKLIFPAPLRMADNSWT